MEEDGMEKDGMEKDGGMERSRKTENISIKGKGTLT